MTVDEFEQERVNIKKRGLSPYVEDHLMGKLRHRYYTLLVDKQYDEINERLKRNIHFLARVHKIKFDVHVFTDYMGVQMDKNFRELVIDKKINYYKYVLWVAAFFGIPSDLLVYTDLEANEETIRTQYPALFK